MRNKLLIVHPEDKTTDFLEDISRYLKRKFGDFIVVDRTRCSSDSFRRTFQNIKYYSQNEHLIVFLGHGRSDALLGPFDPQNKRHVLVNESEGHSLLQGSQILCLACRSAEFLSNKEIEGIGFKNLLTEMNEVFTERQRQNNGLAYYGISEEHIDKIRAELVVIMKYAIEDLIENSRTLDYLYKDIFLRFNSRIARHIYNSSEQTIGEMEPFINALREARDGMAYINALR